MTIQDDYLKPLATIYESFPETTQDALDQDIKKISRYFLAWSLFILIGLGLITSLVYLNPLSENLGSWFQRSGSLISLVAILAEATFIIKLNKLVNVTHPAQLTYEIYLFRCFKPLLNISIFIMIYF